MGRLVASVGQVQGRHLFADEQRRQDKWGLFAKPLGQSSWQRRSAPFVAPDKAWLPGPPQDKASGSWVDISLVDRLSIRLDATQELPAGDYAFEFPVTVPEYIPAYNVWMVTFCGYSAAGVCQQHFSPLALVTFPLAGFDLQPLGAGALWEALGGSVRVGSCGGGPGVRREAGSGGRPKIRSEMGRSALRVGRCLALRWRCTGIASVLRCTCTAVVLQSLCVVGGQVAPA